MKIIASVLLVFFHLSLCAQGDNDPRQKMRQKLSELKGKVNAKSLSIKDFDNVKGIRRIYDRLNLDSALYYVSLELELAEKKEDPDLKAKARFSKANLHWKLQQPDEAHELLSMNLANKKVISDSLLAWTLFRLAKVEVQRQKPAESIEYVVEASKVYQSYNDSTNTADCFSHIAGIYTFVLHEPEKAVPYFKKALRFNQAKDPQNAIRIHINYSSALLELKDVEGALKKIQRAEKIAKASHNEMFLPSVYAQYAFIYNEQENYEESMKYAKIGLSVTKEIPNFDRATSDKLNWYTALNHKALNNNTQALKYFELVKSSPYLDPWMIQSNLVDIYKKTGNFERAFLIQEKMVAQKDSINELERFGKVKEVTERYENEKKQQEIVTLNAEKALQKSEIRTQRLALYGTIAFFVVVILIVTVWYRTRTKLRETTLKLASSELQQRFLRTQLNPHFFFHALTSIEGYIYKNDKMESARFLRSFSGLMRNILEFSDVDLVTLREDIDFIKKYMELQQLNHDFTFNYEVEVSPELRTEDIQIPPMLIQPTVENAILHGALKAENGLVSIQYARVDDQIQITIKDNGDKAEGAKPSSNRLHRSMSLDITETRIKNFEEVHGVAIEYHPYDPGNDANSSVLFRMPLQLGSN